MADVDRAISTNNKQSDIDKRYIGNANMYTFIEINETKSTKQPKSNIGRLAIIDPIIVHVDFLAEIVDTCLEILEADLAFDVAHAFGSLSEMWERRIKYIRIMESKWNITD